MGMMRRRVTRRLTKLHCICKRVKMDVTRSLRRQNVSHVLNGYPESVLVCRSSLCLFKTVALSNHSEIVAVDLHQTFDMCDHHNNY